MLSIPHKLVLNQITDFHEAWYKTAQSYEMRMLTMKYNYLINEN
jgi:hypothetical protein